VIREREAVMALGKYYEDIVEARRENGAAVVFDYQYPQENPKRVGRIETPLEPATAPYRWTIRDRIGIGVFIIKLQSDPERVGPELLEQTFEWTLAHFTELGRRSPEALVRLTMAYRDKALKRIAPEPSYRAVMPPRKPVVLERRGHRTGPGVLHLPSYYAECS
jgi:hypothetical protein